MNAKNFIRTKTKSGFTLIELIIVITIIGVLATLVINNLNDARSRARDAKKKQELANFKTALRMYYNDYQTYPNDTAGNTDLLGCGDGTSACGGPEANFSTSTASYMQKLPQFTFYDQQDNGDGFMVKVTLENASDPDLAASQARCPGTHAATDYVICED
jgi:general secretion pathway protein G